MAARYVKFLRGTPKAYENLAVKDSDTLYFISEADNLDGILYLGNKRIGGTGDLSIASIDELKDVLISEGLSDKSLLVYDAVAAQWVNKSFNELFPIFTGATSELPGVPGLVPAPQTGVTNRFLRSDGKWATIESSGSAGGGSNIITAVDGTFFLLEDQILGLKDLPTSKIIGLDDNLTNTIKAVDGLFKLVDNKVDKVENARLMTNEEGEKLSSLLGITAVSSDFTFTDGTLSFSADFNKGMTEITTSVNNLNDRISAIEQSVAWENL